MSASTLPGSTDEVSESGFNFTCFDKYQIVSEATYDYYMILTAVVSLVIYCFLKERKNRKFHNCPRILQYRPGVSVPVKLIEESRHRFMYIAAFCITGWSLYAMVFSELPFNWDLPAWLSTVVRIIICLIYGLQYYPVFAALSSNSVIGYIWGSLYVWVIAAGFILKHFPCYKGVSWEVVLIQIVRLLPVLILLIYLCLLLPIKTIQMAFFKHKEKEYFKDNDYPQIRHVRYLLKHKHVENYAFYGIENRSSQALLDVEAAETVPKGLRQKAKSMARRLFVTRVYYTSPGFTYSLNVLAACGLSWLVAYIIFTEVVYVYMNYVGPFEKLIDKHDETLKNLSVSMSEFLFWWHSVKGIVFTCLCVAYIITNASILMVLRSYKRDLILRYKGIYAYIPRPRALTSSNANLTIKSTRFLGYQVGYAASGMVIILALLLIVVLVVYIILAIIFRYKQYDILIWLAERILPPAGFLAAIYITQRILVQLTFLARNDRGEKILALDNRRLFHNFQYFMVFINAGVGVLSSILTMVKAAFFGIWALPRTDISGFPRAFETFDSGFTSYCAMIEWDNCLRNPAMVVFCAVELEGVRRRTAKSLQTGCGEAWKRRILLKERVSNRWGLLVTLYNNPGLAAYRHRANNMTNPGDNFPDIVTINL